MTRLVLLKENSGNHMGSKLKVERAEADGLSLIMAFVRKPLNECMKIEGRKTLAVVKLLNKPNMRSENSLYSL